MSVVLDHLKHVAVWEQPFSFPNQPQCILHRTARLPPVVHEFTLAALALMAFN